MIFATNGIVLRTIKYGETSIISTVFTELFGVQSYLINGARTQKKTVKAHFYQPSSLLEMQVYHNDLKNLQSIKEVKWSVIYQSILSDVAKNSVALYMVELLYKCLKQPEPNQDLFMFCEDAFIQMDKAPKNIMANFPLYFALHLSYFFGFQLQNNYSEQNNYFDIREGKFTSESLAGPDFISSDLSYYLSELSRVIHPKDLSEIRMNGNVRLALLKELENYYSWNIPDFGKMKTLDILQEIIR
ncbi:MAG: DNA repair protein RecO [Ginsengibacter sp.]